MKDGWQEALLRLTGQEAWRAWLAEHGAAEKEAWLVIAKKQAPGPGVRYEEAVDEALCFGWIDGLMHPLDGQSYALRFTPRKRGGIWSETNKRRAQRLIEQGLMAEAGLARVAEAQESGEWERATRREDTGTLPDDLRAALEAAPGAVEGLNRLAGSQKKQLLWWLESAKTLPTRQKRIAAIVEQAGASSQKRGNG